MKTKKDFNFYLESMKLGSIGERNAELEKRRRERCREMLKDLQREINKTKKSK